MSKLKELFKSKGILQPGGWFILSKKEAIELIEACNKEKVQILGIDGFFLREKGIQPSLEHSVDFSELELEEAYQRSLEFLNQQPEELFFEVVCSED
ncbi:MAG: hypothetical protein H7A32_01485 [Deltaproteobacteria bacterium]|nr:hypothetical protein [Deltaproteobacteria bacterium]